MLSPGTPPPQQRRFRQDAETPGYAELPVTPPSRRRKRVDRWLRSANAAVPLRLRSPWLLLLPMGVLLFLVAQLYLFTQQQQADPSSSSGGAKAAAAAAANLQALPNFERLRGGHKLFVQYDEKGIAIDKVAATTDVSHDSKKPGEKRQEQHATPIESKPQPPSPPPRAKPPPPAQTRMEAVAPRPPTPPIAVPAAKVVTKETSPRAEEGDQAGNIEAVEAPSGLAEEPPAAQEEGKVPTAESAVELEPPAAPVIVTEKPQTLVALTAPPVHYTHDELYYLKWRFDSEEKDLPYVGNEEVLRRLFPSEQLPTHRTEQEAKAFEKSHTFIGSRKITDLYYNALAVFPGVDASHPHGRLGTTLQGEIKYTPGPMPPPAADVPGGLDAALEKGGFYMPLSNALPLERDTLDSREEVCLQQVYNSTELGDASVVFTYYNEPFSTLMRSVHSVLNQTPPELLREIILVDDHSREGGCEAGSVVDDYVRLLPKVKMMHLGERRGIVTARLAGIKLATAPTVVVLDSHIELNKGWLEPQLQRLRESPKSVVFPQILSIDPVNFGYRTESGIGTFLSFKWMMQERPFAPHAAKSVDAIASPSMAGGLFAVRRDWFYEVGAFDEEFEMWGAENVEFALRVWQCGGRVEGIPCSKTYHIYRMKGSGYKSPSSSLLKNRLRTARLWLDDYYQMAKQFVAKDADTRDIGSFDKILALKEKLKCESFQWFMDNVATNKQPRHITDIELLGDIRNKQFERLCVDTMQGKDGDNIGIYPCHGLGGSQAFMSFKNNPFLMLGGDETHCVSQELKQRSDCDQVNSANHVWKVDFDSGRLRLEHNNATKCLGIRNVEGKPMLVLDECNADDQGQLWQFSKFQLEDDFKLPQESAERVAFKQRRAAWMSDHR